MIDNNLEASLERVHKAILWQGLTQEDVDRRDAELRLQWLEEQQRQRGDSSKRSTDPEIADRAKRKLTEDFGIGEQEAASIVVRHGALIVLAKANAIAQEILSGARIADPIAVLRYRMTGSKSKAATVPA